MEGQEFETFEMFIENFDDIKSYETKTVEQVEKRRQQKRSAEKRRRENILSGLKMVRYKYVDLIE